MTSSSKRPVPEVMLLRYLAGDLPAAERAQIDAERRDSPELAARIAELEREQAAYFSTHPPDAAAHRLWTQLSVEDSKAIARRSTTRWWRWFLLPSAATAAAVLFAVFVVQESHERATPTLGDSESPRSDVELAEAAQAAPAAPEQVAPASEPTRAPAEPVTGPADESKTHAAPSKPAATGAVTRAARKRPATDKQDAPTALGGAEGLAFGDGGGGGGGVGVAAPRGSGVTGTGMGGGGLAGKGTQGFGRGATGTGAGVSRSGAAKKERVVEREEPSRDVESRPAPDAGPAEDARRVYAAPPPVAVVPQAPAPKPAPKVALPANEPMVAPESAAPHEAKSAASLADDADGAAGELARRAPPRPHAELVLRSGGEVRRSRAGTASAGAGDRVFVIAELSRDAYVLVVAARAAGTVQTLWRGRMTAGERREIPVTWPPTGGQGPLYLFVIASDEPLDAAGVLPESTPLPASYAGAIRAEAGSFVRLRVTARP